MIVYGDGGNQVWTLNPDGSGRHLLLKFGADPGISPDGRHIAFVAGVVDRTIDQYVPRLFVMNADGSGKRQVPIRLAAAETWPHPDWSPDGSTIIFSGGTQGKEVDHIYSVKPDGSALKQLTSGPDSGPAWSPDGKRVAFVRYRYASRLGFDLFVMNADGSNQHKLTAGFEPDWSPDGKSIAFDDTGGIEVINPDGAGLHLLLGRASRPEWSPDGKKIAYSFGQIGEPTNGIYTMNADGSGKRQLTHLAFGSVDSISWQPSH
jgi:Tol biopolymer transport system component